MKPMKSTPPTTHSFRKNSRILAGSIAALVTAGFLASPEPARATDPWTGNADGDWSGLNWDSVPSPLDTLVFDDLNLTGALVTATNNDAVLINVGGITFNGLSYSIGGSAFTLNGTIDTTGAATISANLTLGSGGGVLIANATSSLDFTGTFDAAAQTVDVSGAGSVSFANAITNGATLSQSGAGSLILTGTNAFSNLVVDGGSVAGGVITLDSGATALTSHAASFVDSDLTLTTAPGTITSNLGTLSLGGTLDAGAMALTIAGAGNVAFTNAIVNSTTLNKTDVGTLTLVGDNAFTSATFDYGTTTGGNLVLSGGATALGGGLGNRSVNSAILMDTVAGTITSDAATLTLGGTVDANFMALTFDGAGNTTISNAIANGTTLTKNGTGTLTISSGNTYTGATAITNGAVNIRNATSLGSVAGGVVVSAGAALQIQNGISVGNKSLTLNGTGVASDGALRNLSGTNTWGGTITLASSAQINSDAGTLTLSAANSITGPTQSLTLGGAGNGSVNGTMNLSTGSLTKEGGGTWTILGLPTFTGGTVINGGTLHFRTDTFSPNGALFNIGNVTVASGAVFQGERGHFTGPTLTLNGGTWSESNGFGGSWTGAVVLGATSVITSSYNQQITGNITGAGGLTKTGGGTLTLNGAGSAFGTTTVSAGTMQLGTGNPGQNGTITGPIIDNATLTFNNGSPQTHSGAISGTGAVNKSGFNTLTMSVANTYTGLTTVTAGVLSLNDAAALPGGIDALVGLGESALTLNGGLIGLTAASGDFIRGSGTGAGQVQWANNGTGGFTAYGGDRAVNLGGASAGLIWNTAGPFGSAGLFLSSFDSDSKVTFQNPIDLNAALRTVTVANGTSAVDGELSGVLSGATGGINKAGAGTLVLSADNTYAGATTISQSILKLGATGGATNTPLGTIVGNTTVSATGAALDVGGFTLGTAEPLTLNGTGISSNGALTNSGAAATYSGPITLATAANLGSTNGELTVTGGISGVATTLTTALTNGQAGVVSLAVAALTTAIPSGTILTLGSGATAQNVVTSSATAAGATSIAVTSFTSGAAFAIGSATTANTGLTFSGSGNTTIATTAIHSSSTPILKMGSGNLTFAVNSATLNAPISVNNGTFTLNGAAVLGNVSSTISVTTSQANRTDQTLTSALLPVGFQVGSFVLGQMVERVSGTSFNLSGGPSSAFSAVPTLVAYTSGVQALPGGAIVIDNSGTNVNNRLGGRALGLGAATFTMTPSASGAVTESLSGLVLMMGESTITLNADPGFQTNVTAGLLGNRFMGNTALIRGSNFGSAAANGVATLTLTAAPTFLGTTSAGGTPTTQGILPWVIVDSNATGLGSSFATTTGAGQRLRPLTAGEMSVASAYTANSNAWLAGAQPLLTANTTVNSLTITGGNVTITNPAFPAALPLLTITSGGLLSTTAASTISGGVLSWGNGQLQVFTPAATAGANILTVASRVTGQGLVKAGGGTLTLSSTSPAYAGFSQNAISGGLGAHNGSVYLNEGTTQLNAHNAIGTGGATGGTNDNNLLNVAYGATLDLNGKTQFVGPVTSQLFLNNTGENLLDIRGGTITSSTTANLVAYVGNPGGGAPGPFNFGGSITGSVGLAVGGEGNWTQALTGANSYSGPTLVYQTAVGGSGLALKDGGTLSGTSRVDISFGGSFQLDNTGTVNLTDRVNNAADIGLSGGSLTFTGRAQTISTETLGAVTAVAGNSTITTNPTNTGVNAAELTLTSLSRTTGATLNFNTNGSALGQLGFANNPRVFITNPLAGNLALTGAANNQIIPGVVIGGDLASYNATTGIGALNQTGFPAYTTANLNTLGAVSTANYSGNGAVLSGGQTINALKPNGTITFVNGGDILTLTSGMVASSNQTYGTTSVRGGLTSATSELILHSNGGNTTVHSVVSGANKLVLASGGTYTLTAANTQTGGTTVDGGTLALTNNALATPLVVGVPNATVATDGLILNGATATLTNSPGQIGSSNIVTLNGNSTLTLFGGNTLAGLSLNHIGQTAPVVNTTPSAFGATASSTDITLTLTGGITSTTNNIRGIAQINGRVALPASPTLNIGAATFNTLIINPIQADLIVTGLTGGGGTITKTGAGTLQFNMPTTITGTLAVTSGGLQFGLAGAGARLADVVLSDGTWLNINNFAGVFGSLATTGTGTGFVTNTGTTQSTLTVGFDNASTTFAGSFQRFNDSTINLINLQKIGTGMMTLKGNTSTASGAITINSTGGGGLIFKDTGVNNFRQTAITVNAGGTLTLDDSGTANLSNRLGNVGVTLSGGSFVSTAAAAGSTETTTGALTFNTGEATVTLNQGAISNVTTFSNLNFGAGGTGTFGGANFSTAVNKVMLTTTPGFTGNILPRVSVGTEFATYNQDGLGVANTNGVQAISASASSSPANIASALFSANLKITSAVTSRNLVAAQTINSLNIADNSVNIGTNGGILPSQGLTISSGGVIVNGTGAVISTPVTTLNTEGVFRVNSGQDLTMNTRIGGSVALTKTGLGEMTIGKLADYTGITTVNQGTLKLASGLGKNALLVTVAAGNPTAQALQVNGGGTFDLNGNHLLVGTINSSNPLAGGGGTITNSSATAATLNSFGGGTFGGQITGNLNLTLANNAAIVGSGNTNAWSTGTYVFRDQQSYTGDTMVRGANVTLQDKGALTATPNIELNESSIYFDNSGLNPSATPPARVRSDVAITLNQSGLNFNVGASADNAFSFGTVNIGYGQNLMNTGGQNNANTGTLLGNGAGATQTVTIGNLANSGNGGFLNFIDNPGNQIGYNTLAHRTFITSINGTPVTAGSMLPAWVTMSASNTTEFTALSSTGAGIVRYGDTTYGAPAYITTALGGNQTGEVHSNAASALGVATSTVKALKLTGALTFSAPGNSLNLESGGLITTAALSIGDNTNRGVLTAGGTVASGTTDLILFTPGGAVTVNSVIADTSTVLGSGTGKLRLVIHSYGSAVTLTGNNTYSGGTFVDTNTSPTPLLLSGAGVIIPAGGLTLNGTSGNGAATLTTTATGQIATSNDVTLRNSGYNLTMLAGGTDTLSSLIFNNQGGAYTSTVTTGANLILSGTGTQATTSGYVINSTNSNLGSIPTIAGTLLTIPDGATINTTGDAPTNLIISAPLATAAATLPLHKTGTGSVQFTNQNSFTNGFNLDGGTIVFTAASVGGGTGGTQPTTSQIGKGTLTIGDGTAIMGSSALSIGNVVNVANNASFTFGTLGATNARATATNNLTLTNTVTLGTGAHTINVNGLNMTGTISGQLTGGTNFTKDGPGTLILNNATNNFGGSVTVSGGTLQHNVAGSIPAGAIITVASGAGLNINAISQSVDSLNGGGVVFNPGGAAVLTINGATNGAFSGVIAATTAANLSVVKNGANSQTFSGANVYGGATTVTAGILVAGNAAALGTIAVGTTVASGASLDVQANIGTEAINVRGIGDGGNGALATSTGTGTVGGTVTLAANTSIGGAGTLNINGVVAAGAFTVDKVGAGTTNFGTTSTLTSLGTLNATAGTTNVNSVLGTGSSDVAVTGATSLKFGSVSQTLSSLSIDAGSTVTFGSGLASFGGEADKKAPSFGGGSAVVPEPGTIGLLLVGALGVLNRRRRVG